VPQLLDREFELLDQQYPRLRLRFRGQPGRALGAQHRLQRGYIVGERIIESDIFVDESHDYDDDVLEGFDFVVVSIHGRFKLDRKAQTLRLLRAISLVAIGKDGVSHFQLLQNALRREAKLLYCAFDLMLENAADLRKQPLLERKKRLKAILPRDKLIASRSHRKGDGKKFFAEATRKGLEGLMAKRADSAYTSGSPTPDIAIYSICH
jgi:ATP dependent DNA ligase domain